MARTDTQTDCWTDKYIGIQTGSLIDLHSYTNRLMDRQNERKTGCQAPNRWTGCRAVRQTDGLTVGQADKQTGRPLGRQTNRQADRWAGRQTDGQTVGQADSWTDLQTDRLGLRLFNVSISFFKLNDLAREH